MQDRTGNPNGIAIIQPSVARNELRWVNVPEKPSTLKGLNQKLMPQSLAKILVHAVFSTKDRRPFLRDKNLREEMHRYLGGILNQLDCQPVIVGGVEDHVHLLCALSRTCQAAEMVKEVKRGSSLWIKTKSADLHDFAWQSGYGIFSIGFSQIPAVQNYISRQEEHHRNVSFQDEFREFLRRYEIKFDERYIWD